MQIRSGNAQLHRTFERRRWKIAGILRNFETNIVRPPVKWHNTVMRTVPASNEMFEQCLTRVFVKEYSYFAIVGEV